MVSHAFVPTVAALCEAGFRRINEIRRHRPPLQQTNSLL